MEFASEGEAYAPFYGDFGGEGSSGGRGGGGACGDVEAETRGVHAYMMLETMKRVAAVSCYVRFSP